MSDKLLKELINRIESLERTVAEHHWMAVDAEAETDPAWVAPVITLVPRDKTA